MNITQKLVNEVKKSNSKKLHDQAWHDFQGSSEVEAINFALGNADHDYSLSDIVREAKQYLIDTADL